MREMLAIRLHQHGGPENLRPEQVPVPEPGAGEALVRVDAAGVNFIEVYQRTGLYAVPLPVTPGGEGAGVVEAVGAEVEQLRPGDRVAWAGGGLGAYAEYATVAAARLVPISAALDARTAAAMMLQGMTAHYLAVTTYPLEAGDRCLVHAAAGRRLTPARAAGQTAGPIRDRPGPGPMKRRIPSPGGGQPVMVIRRRTSGLKATLTGGRGCRCP